MKGYRKLNIRPSRAELAARRKRQEDERRWFIESVKASKQSATAYVPGSITGAKQIDEVENGK